MERRLMLGGNLNIYDHFIRAVLANPPVPDADIYYSTHEDYIELRYLVFGRQYLVHINRSEIQLDFWGSVSTL
jgi:hypothetical protein